MEHSILVALSDSMVSRSVLDYLVHLGLKADQQQINLLHVLIQPKAEKDLMGKKFVAEKKERMQSFLAQAKEKLEANGFPDKNIQTTLLMESFPSVTDGILDQFNQGNYDMVLIGRKRMSKSEEFVLGDISIKLIRALENTAVVVVKSS